MAALTLAAVLGSATCEMTVNLPLVIKFIIQSSSWRRRLLMAVLALMCDASAQKTTFSQVPGSDSLTWIKPARPGPSAEHPGRGQRSAFPGFRS